MIADDDSEDVDYDFDSEDDSFGMPMFVFRSLTGRVFLSALAPPDGFETSGAVTEVGDLTILDVDRPIPTVNWVDEDPAVLFWFADTNNYAIGFEGGADPPSGYVPLGHDFAFVIDESNLKRAVEADR